MKDKILLFIPMYNCEKQIVRVLDQITPESQAYFTEILIVNNRSTDAGEQAVICYASAHPHLPITLVRNDENYGLGGSHKVAFSYALTHQFDYVITLHGDDQGNIADILPYLKSRQYTQYDCMLGARFMKGSRLEGYSKFRAFGNRVYNGLFSVGTGLRIYDLGAGLNMYKTTILKKPFYQKFSDNLLFNYCMILALSYYNQTYFFFPISWRETDQVSNVKLTSQALTVLQLLALYIINKNRFMQQEHRVRPFAHYGAKQIYPQEKHD